jgi:hypothetical protein
MNVKLDMNMLNCVLLVVVLVLVIMCCMKTNNENFKDHPINISNCNKYNKIINYKNRKLACKKDTNCLVNFKKRRCEGKKYISKIVDGFRFADEGLSTKLQRKIKEGKFCSNFCTLDGKDEGYSPRLTTLRNAAAMNYNKKCNGFAIREGKCNLDNAKLEFQKDICNYKACRDGCRNYTKGYGEWGGRMTKNGKFVPNCYKKEGNVTHQMVTTPPNRLCPPDPNICNQLDTGGKDRKQYCEDPLVGDTLKKVCPILCNTTDDDCVVPVPKDSVKLFNRKLFAKDRQDFDRQ